MATGSDVLTMLIPDGGWVIYGDKFESIIYNEGVNAITKKQFEDGFDQYDAWKLQQDNAKAAARQAILDRLGLTNEEAALLLS
jgi:hypothetical protein